MPIPSSTIRRQHGSPRVTALSTSLVRRGPQATGNSHTIKQTQCTVLTGIYIYIYIYIYIVIQPTASSLTLFLPVAVHNTYYGVGVGFVTPPSASLPIASCVVSLSLSLSLSLAVGTRQTHGRAIPKAHEVTSSTTARSLGGSARIPPPTWSPRQAAAELASTICRAGSNRSRAGFVCNAFIAAPLAANNCAQFATAVGKQHRSHLPPRTSLDPRTLGHGE